ncbi:hypothetical protein QOZ80_4AG0313990 [Eleusine coracana subsp. coracana]|nr:hypothetical protein QOZ80_4AG0313990 [Eleusine coracana subsp. coracana]
MDLRAYYIQAAEAAAPAVHADDDDGDDVVEVELTPRAVLLKLEVQAAPSVADVGAAASRRDSGGGFSPSPLVVGGGRDLTCPECGKAFLSDKAMYGHLRSHPERGYKGANRPAATTASPGSKRPRTKAPKQREEDDDELSTTKWPVTAKRGRVSSSVPVAAVQSSSWCSEDEEAAMILVEMSSRGARSESENRQQSLRPVVRVRDAKNQIPDVEEQPPPVLNDHVDQDQTPELLPLKMLAPADHQHVVCAVTAAHQRTPDDAAQQIVQPELAPDVTMVDQSQTPPPEVKDLTTHLENPAKSVVVVVARDAQSAPAVGGAKKRRHRGPPEQTPESAANDKPPRRIPSPASDKRHECLVCGKSFPTHQALGGHMSGHNKWGGGKHGDPAAVVQAMHNILAHRRKSCDSVVIGGGTGAAEGAAVDCESQEGASVVGGGQDGDVVVSGTEQAGVAGGAQECAVAEPPAPHACPDCGMTFRSGQALGGHKRKHWYPEKQQAKAAARNFDLNALPSDDGEAENQP